MKKIEAFIRTSCFDAIKEALDKFDFVFLVYEDIKGGGNETRQKTAYRGQQHRLVSIPRIRITIIIDDDQVQKVLDTITENARTGEAGDGKIIITHIEKALSINTGKETD